MAQILMSQLYWLTSIFIAKRKNGTVIMPQKYWSFVVDINDTKEKGALRDTLFKKREKTFSNKKYCFKKCSEKCF